MEVQLYSDDELILMIQSRKIKDENLAIRTICQLYQVMIKNLVLRNSGTTDDAKLVFHDGLISFIQQVRKNDFILTSSLSTYLFSICRYKWLMELRKRKNNRETSIITDYEWIPVKENIFQKMELNEGAKILNHILDQLGKDCKTIIHFYYFLKLKMVQIAKELNIPNEAAAKNRKARCLKKLRILVNNDLMYKKDLNDYLQNIINS